MKPRSPEAGGRIATKVIGGIFRELLPIKILAHEPHDEPKDAGAESKEPTDHHVPGHDVGAPMSNGAGVSCLPRSDRESNAEPETSVLSHL